MKVFITGIATKFDVELARVFAQNGHEVYAGDSSRGYDAEGFAEILQFNPDCPDSIDKARGLLFQNPGYIDLYINTTDYKSPGDNFSVSDNIDYDVMREVYTANVLRTISMYEGFLPLVKNGELKRYCFITSVKASVNLCADISGYAYNMSKAGLHNFLQIIKNKLAPEGFTFRVFDPLSGGIPDDLAGRSAYSYFTRRRAADAGRDDETRLVIRDAFGRQYGW